MLFGEEQESKPAVWTVRAPPDALGAEPEKEIKNTETEQHTENGQHKDGEPGSAVGCHGDFERDMRGKTIFRMNIKTDCGRKKGIPTGHNDLRQRRKGGSHGSIYNDQWNCSQHNEGGVH